MDSDDLLFVINNFGGPGPAGDIVPPVGVDIEDVLAVINNWGACPMP